MLPEFELRFRFKITCPLDAYRSVRFALSSIAIAVFTLRVIVARDRIDVVTNQISIKFTLRSAQQFEGHNQKDDGNAAANESSIGSNMPGFGKKACVDEQRTEILHEDPEPIPIPIPLILEALEVGVGALVVADMDEAILMSITACG
ncbi:MAG: hypothetical protein LQ347_006137 [Umbilicaria vellea]|nr:MAG: hypothetical protein LQ347_006137 [Umbilicaria vellea]